MITPLEIENKRFSKKTLNGYDPEEVDIFLDDLTRDYSLLYKESNEKKKEIEDLKSKLEHYISIEDTLQKTLLMAQTAADDIKIAAQKQAEQIIKDAEQNSRQATFGIEQEINQKTQELNDVKKQFDVYKAKMESLLIAQLELLKEIDEEK